MIYGGDAVDASAVERECDERSDCELLTRRQRGWSLRVRLALVPRKQGCHEGKWRLCGCRTMRRFERAGHNHSFERSDS